MFFISWQFSHSISCLLYGIWFNSALWHMLDLPSTSLSYQVQTKMAVKYWVLPHFTVVLQLRMICTCKTLHTLDTISHNLALAEVGAAFLLLYMLKVASASMRRWGFDWFFFLQLHSAVSIFFNYNLHTINNISHNTAPAIKLELQQKPAEDVKSRPFLLDFSSLKFAVQSLTSTLYHQTQLSSCT